jgi:energy-coupling factor transporter ATP-binding protein EcfA2
MQNTTIDYISAFNQLILLGKKTITPNFNIQNHEKMIVFKLLAYFLQDEETASKLNINLKKGILLSGPIGCGKTSLMNLMRHFQPTNHRFIIRSCRDLSFEFYENGFSTIHKYSNLSFKNFEPIVYCFDDLGAENTLKHFGNECNVMAEILLSRYDAFISRKLITHVTTNLSATEIETFYGCRVRSRMRELFNLISFNAHSNDKRT